MRTFILSAPGREAISWATVANLRRQNPGEPFSVFCAPGRGGIADFWSLLAAAAAAGDDALLLEDDVVTARNFLRFAGGWQAPFMTSFFFVYGGQQLLEPEDPRTFGGNQALWFPRGLLTTLAAIQPPATARLQDDALAVILADLGESVLYHRSLVDHTGTLSLCRPGQWMPRATDFIGEDFDCLALPGYKLPGYKS